MRILCLGDVVGEAGCEAVLSRLPGLIHQYALDFVVVNAENAANGFGITETLSADLLNAGADVLTGGNHSWDKREALSFIERQPRLLRPLNFPVGAPGKGSGIFHARNGEEVLVVNLIGRALMNNLLDDPFAAAEQVLTGVCLGQGVQAILIDFHAEATSEKQAMAHFVDGNVSLIVGTHTHVPTADHRILPGGTAMMTDIGMCGDYDSVIGMEKEEPLQRFLRGFRSKSFAPANGEVTLSGVIVDTDPETGLALSVSPLRLGGQLQEREPDFCKLG